DLERASDLARQMLAAKLGRADAIFASDPFDPERGLLHPDGSPSEIYLPWRTVALALAGATYQGQFEMPNRSPNAVFDHGSEVVVVSNPFPQGISGKAVVHFPAGWEIDPLQWTLQAGAGEKFKLPLLLTFPPNAALGELRTSIDFEVAGDRPYKFSMFLPYRL